MKNLKTLYNNNNVSENNENSYLYFNIGDSKYAVNVRNVVEIMKLPMLEYPQRLANNVVGLLNYNNFTINVLDLRFYLNIKVLPYSLSNQLLIVKTDEAIFGIIIDKVEDIITLEQSQVEYFQFTDEKKIIEFLYKHGGETVSVVNLSVVEDILKHGVESTDVDISALFPRDDSSRYKLMQRNQALVEKFQSNLITNVFAQDKFISFSLNSNYYCINLRYVQEFLKHATITPIPCDLDYVEGVITLRGDFVTVIDIKKFLGINYNSSETVEKSATTNIIIIQTSDFKIGFLVDEIFSIIDITEESINENPHNYLDRYILSEVVIEDNLYTILDMKNILADERFYIEDSM